MPYDRLKRNDIERLVRMADALLRDPPISVQPEGYRCCSYCGVKVERNLHAVNCPWTKFVRELGKIKKIIETKK